MAELRSEITVSVDDTDAQNALNELLKKLERARELAMNVPMTGDGKDGAPGGGPGSGKGPAGGTDAGAAKQEYTARDLARKNYENRRLLQESMESVGRALDIGFSGANSPSASLRLFGHSVTSTIKVMNAGIESMLQAGSSILGPISGLLGAATLGAHTGTRIMSSAVDARFQRIQQLTGLERPLAQARAAGDMQGGVGSAAVGLGTRFGFQVGESAQMLAGLSRSIGTEGGLATAMGRGGFNPFQAALSGMSPELMARFISMGGPGGGAVGGITGASLALRGASGTLQGQGLRGAKVDEALARISSATTQLAEQGLVVDLSNLNQTIANIGATSPGLRGMQAVRTASRMMQAGPQAASQFGAGFGGLVSAAIQAEAFSRTSDPLEAMAIMQELAQDPSQVQQILTSQLGTDAAGLAMAGAGFAGARDSRAMAAGLAQGEVTTEGAMGAAGAGDVPMSSLLARRDREILMQVSAGAATNVAILNVMKRIEGFITDLSDLAGPYLQGVDATLRYLSGRP